jgi:ankyrin repeat protein
MRRKLQWRRAAVAFWLIARAGSAAGQCTVDEAALVVPLQPGGIELPALASAPPSVKVTTVTRTAGPVVAGSSAAPAAGSTPRPPRPAPRDDQERLFIAVADGDLAEVERMVSSPTVDLNAPMRSDLRRSLIDIAAGSAQPRIARALIEHGARVRAPVDGVDVRPIGAALVNLRIELQLRDDPAVAAAAPPRSPQDVEATIRVLLDAGADADGVFDPTHPESALVVLLSMPRFDGDLRIARLLLDHGAQLGAATPGGSPLAAAVAAGREDFVDLALQARQLDASALDAALAAAIARNDAAMARRLFAAGASPNAPDRYGRPLLCATLNGGQSRPLALLLAQHGARPDVDCPGGPPLNRAMTDPELALLLLKHGADPDRAGLDGFTALDLVRDADHELVDALLAHGAHLGTSAPDPRFPRRGDPGAAAAGPTVRAILSHRDYLAAGLLHRDGLQGDTPCAAVLYASASGAHRALTGLLQAGADPNAATQRGVTALMTAAYRRDVEALRLLLAQPKIQVDRATPAALNPQALVPYSESNPSLFTGGATALMFAAAAGNAQSCTLLIQHGASTRVMDAQGRTAAAYALSPEVRAALQSSGGAPQIR